MLIGVFNHEPKIENRQLWAGFCDALIVVSSFNDPGIEQFVNRFEPEDNCYLLFILQNSKPKGQKPENLTADGYAVRWKDSFDCEVYHTAIIKASLFNHQWYYDGEWYGKVSTFLDNFYIKTDLPVTNNHLYLCAGEYLLQQQRFHQAVKCFEQRSKRLGFDQELYYCYVKMAQCYRGMNKSGKMLEWINKALEFRPDRNEALLLAANYYRLLPNKQHQAWSYLQKVKKETDDFYKVNHNSYQDCLYERTIIDYYVQPEKGLANCVEFLNLPESSGRFGEVYNRMMFYYSTFPQVDWKQLFFTNLEDHFISSSISVDSDKQAIIRTVDYRISENGSYILQNGLVRTLNYLAKWDNDQRCFGSLTKIEVPSQLPRRPDSIKGLEDMRLCNGYITATTREHSYCGWNKIVYGHLDQPQRWQVIRTPNEHSCEKNWIPLPDGRVIFLWHPYTIITINNDIIDVSKTITKPTPPVFREFRGSSGVFKVQGKNLAIIHLVHNRPGQPRQYVHSWVEFDENFLPVAYSLPFKFIDRHSIEYCLSAQSFDDQNIELFISSMDRESWHGRVDAKTVIDSIVMKI